ALNKWDIARHTQIGPRLLEMLPRAIPISATTGYNLDLLRQRMTEILSERLIPATARLPYDRLELLELVHGRGRVIVEEYRPEHVYLEAEVDREVLARLAPFLTSE
ncbi:MAG: hypothetical protein H5T86_09560, partial [Armatimonadetes bacterium]|nr:hypothetical protein [Armatimonadota bacterium]